MLLYEQLKRSASDPFQMENDINYVGCNDSVKQLFLDGSDMKVNDLACETQVVALI